MSIIIIGYLIYTKEKASFLWLFLIFCVLPIICKAQIKPAVIFSDHMILQRDISIPVWGKAKQSEKIQVELEDNSISGSADATGKWLVYLPSFSAGGPYELKITGESETLVFKDVLIGDVWFASGQSNMEHPMQGWEWIPESGVQNFEDELKDADYPEIRFFDVPKFLAPIAQNNLTGGQWSRADASLVAKFSSTAWFFAKELHHHLNIPIGIIHSSWGGTPIRTWMSRESLLQFKDSLNLPALALDFDHITWISKVESSLQNHRHRRRQISHPPPHLPGDIAQPLHHDQGWKNVDLPYVNTQSQVLWLRREIEIPDQQKNLPITISMGYLNRQSHVYFNGTEIGYFQYPEPVKFTIPASLMKVGTNVLAVRLANPGKKLEVFGKPEDFSLTFSGPDQSKMISNSWQVNYQLETVIDQKENFQNNPSFLFNGMVAPVIPYGIKGVIWYQGESDVNRPLLYEGLFRELINDWRSKWKLGDLPFLFVQLSNLERSHDFSQQDEAWCGLRLAQEKALTLPNTGMVVSVDIGDSLDIHPKNKKIFGQRLAKQAMKLSYHQDIVANGPKISDYQVKADTVVIDFEVGSGKLFVDETKNCGLKIAGRDKIFHQAEWRKNGNQLLVFSRKVKLPVSVEYACETNPKLCIFNEDGLPAAPFQIKVNK